MHTSWLCVRTETWKQNASPAAHFNNTIDRQFSQFTNSHQLSAILHLQELPIHIWFPMEDSAKIKEEKQLTEYLCIAAADISPTGVLAEDRMDWSGQGKQGIDLHLKTCCGPLSIKRILSVGWCDASNMLGWLWRWPCPGMESGWWDSMAGETTIC